MRTAFVHAAWLLALAGCSVPPSGTYQGYLEGEFVYLAPPLAGTLTRLAVNRGDEVQPGQLLFTLNNAPETAAQHEAEQRLAQGRARQLNLQKGRRPSELAALAAQLERAQANLRLAELELQRRRQLSESEVISPAELDTARSQVEADQAQVATLTAELDTARLGAREDEIQAAAAEVQALEAALRRAQWAVEEKRQYAPTNGVVHDTLYRVGEWVSAGAPVVVLLPPQNIKARFFVSESIVANTRVGQSVTVIRDGAEGSLKATISYVAPQAEFTPPVIYSQESRAKFVYLVEAQFEASVASGLRPGQPIDVRLKP
jgi:HlyD family secretion protein